MSSTSWTGWDRADEVLRVAIGRDHRLDPVVPRTGGPAGNARLTAWLGIALLVGFAAEGVTVLRMDQLLTWHIALGALLVPPALVKTGTTGWRIARYYGRHREYRVAGPPPLVLRVLGPLVVATTLAVLGSGLALVALGPRSSRRSLGLGFGVDAVTVHQALFFAWLAVMAVHVLCRTVPALVIIVGRRAPGVAGRVLVLATTAALVVVCVLATLAASHAWTTHRG